MSSFGHATKAEIEQIKVLESQIDIATSQPEKLIDLAVFYIEPCHQEPRAIEILRSVVNRFPNNGLAKIWLSYSHLHFSLMPQYLKEAKALLRSLEGEQVDASVSAAAKLLLAQILDELGGEDESIRLNLISEAVKLAPEWPYAHADFAWILERHGRIQDAVKEMDLALKMGDGINPSWTHTECVFHLCITGRAADHCVLRDELARLQKMTAP